MTKTNPTRKSVASNAQTIATLALALALMLAAGCKEEAKPKPGESTEKPMSVAEEAKSNENLCNGEEYDPEKQFCNNGIHDKCNGKKYIPYVETCIDGKVMGICDSKTYDPETQGCCSINDGGAAVYDLETQGCGLDDDGEGMIFSK